MRTRKYRYGIVVVAAAMTTSACLHGPTVSSFPPAQTPYGIQTTIEAQTGATGHVVAGELLAVQDDGLILHEGVYGLVFVAYDQIERATFQKKRSLSIGARRTPVEGKREALRLLSRFPQGLEDPVLTEMLRQLGQESLRLLEEADGSTAGGGDEARDASAD